MAPLTAVGGRDDVAPVRAPRCDHALDRLGREIGAVGEDDDRRLDVVAELGEPGASDAPGPRFQPAQVTTRAGVSSVCAPATTTISSTGSRSSRSSTSGSSSRCFGVPNRDASPAASTTAASSLLLDRDRLDHDGLRRLLRGRVAELADPSTFHAVGTVPTIA